MTTVATILAGVALAVAAAFGFISSQVDGVNGSELPANGTVVPYDQGL